MKEVYAIVRMNMMNKTKQALAEAGLGSITARNALGRGKGIVDLQLLQGAEHGFEEAIAQLGQSQRLIPKRALLMIVKDDLVEKATTGDKDARYEAQRQLCQFVYDNYLTIPIAVGGQIIAHSDKIGDYAKPAICAPLVQLEYVTP